jgi:tRNA threonylcarbamoyladenosine biosynthesis protein TsaE
MSPFSGKAWGVTTAVPGPGGGLLCVTTSHEHLPCRAGESHPASLPRNEGGPPGGSIHRLEEDRALFPSSSVSETIRLGKKIGRLLQQGDVIALIGELGSGKTQFVTGLARGAGVGQRVCLSSPTFTLVHQYEGRVPFYHIDLYRIETDGQVEDLGLEEYVFGQGITAIEWADRFPAVIPREALRVTLLYSGKNGRSIELVGRGKRCREIIKAVGGR